MTQNQTIMEKATIPEKQGACEYFEEYIVVVNGKEYGPLKHHCTLSKNHTEQNHRCSFGKVIGKHNPEYGERMSVGIFAQDGNLIESRSFSLF